MTLLTKFFILQWYTLIHGIGKVCGGGCREGGGGGLGGRSYVGGAVHMLLPDAKIHEIDQKYELRLD